MQRDRTAAITKIKGDRDGRMQKMAGQYIKKPGKEKMILAPDMNHQSEKMTITLQTLQSSLQQGSRLPPVHLWNPPFCGDMDMRIARDGAWYYLGSPIGRPALVRLFASILKREGDDYFLVTPVEKVRIRVDDSPFLGVALEAVASDDSDVPWLVLTTLTGERVVIDEQHPLAVGLGPGGDPAPRVHVRDGLHALLSRPLYYELVERAQTVDDDVVVCSGNKCFSLLPAVSDQPVI